MGRTARTADSGIGGYAESIMMRNSLKLIFPSPSPSYSSIMALTSSTVSETPSLLTHRLSSAADKIPSLSASNIIKARRRLLRKNHLLGNLSTNPIRLNIRRIGLATEFCRDKRISCLTAWFGCIMGLFVPFSYSIASVDAASMAASASNSHRALDTDAAPANNAASAGKTLTPTTCPTTVIADVDASKNGNSTTAAVVAAHKADRAEVKGKIAALLDP